MKHILLITLIALSTRLGMAQGLADPGIARPITVAGAVKEPLTFHPGGPVTLLEAITRAGGLTSVAGLQIVVSQAQAPSTRRVSIQALIEGTDPHANLRLFGGEEVRVPELGRVLVVGNVNRPGAFPLEKGAETSVLRMLALAEGLGPNAGMQAFIYRPKSPGGKNPIPIALSRILIRQAPDAALQVNDILYVPDNRTRPLKFAILEKLLLVGGAPEVTGPGYPAR